MPSNAAPDVTPLVSEVVGWGERTAVLLRPPRFCKTFGRATRLGGIASGELMVTGGSWAGWEAARSCAIAGSAQTADEAAAKNIRNKTPRTAMPPRDTTVHDDRAIPTQPPHANKGGLTMHA